MSSLLSLKQAPDSKGRIQKITPESAGWKYVGFEVFMLKSGKSLEQKTTVRKFVLYWFPEKPISKQVMIHGIIWESV